MALEEIGAKLTLKDRRQFSAEAAAAAASTRELGAAAKTASKNASLSAAPSGGFGLLRATFGFVATAAKTGIVALAGAAVAAVGFGIKTRASMEQAQIGFTTMLGSAAKAKSFMEDIKTFAKDTPFQLSDVIGNSQSVLAMGFAAKDVLPLLNDVGNAVAAVGGGAEGLNRVTLALGQIRSKGVLQAQDFRQLQESRTFGIQDLAKQLGVTEAAVSDMMEKKQISALTAIEAFQRSSQQRFGGLMQKQSTTITGIWSNIQDAISIGLGDAIIPFQDDIKSAERSFLGFVSNIFDRLPAISARIRSAIPDAWQSLMNGDATGVAAAVDSAFGAGGKLVPALTKIVQLGMDFWTLLRDGIIPAFGALSRAIPLGTLNLSAEIMRILADHATIAGPAIIAIAFAYYTVRTAMLVTTKVMKAITIAQWAWNAAADANPYVLLAIAFAVLAVEIYMAYKKFDGFRRLVDNTARWIKDHWKEALVVGLTGPVGLAADVIYRNWDSIVAFTESLPGRITSAATGMFDGVFNAFAGTVNGMLDWWNKLDFTLDFPTQSTPFGDIGGWSFTLGTPDIPFRVPTLGAGGIALATPGGTLARLAEAGRNEAVVPLPRPNEVSPLAAQFREFVGGGPQGSRPIEVNLKLDRRTIARATVSGIGDDAARS